MPRTTVAGSSIDLVTRTPDQAAAQALEDRWLAFIRDAGSGSPSHATFNYLGGDVTDCVAVGSSVTWVGSDWFDGTTVDADDTYTGDALPVRNGAVLEATAGTFSQQLYASGTSGVWLNAVTQGGLVAGSHWWPIAAVRDGSTTRILCWHVDPDVGPWGGLLDTHLVALNVFGGYASHVATGIGDLTDTFNGDGILADTDYTYVYGEEFVPGYDADAADDGSVPNYGVGADRPRHFTRKRVARVAAGSLATVASWRYWDGSDWVADVTDATPMVDATGRAIEGDAGVAKVDTDHYLLAAHQLIEPWVRVYRASVPQGPWTLIARVPAPTQGDTFNGGQQIGQLTKVLPTQAHPAGVPDGHRIVMLSRNLLDPTEAFSERDIRRYAPQFVVVPTTAQAAPGGAWETWANIAREAAADAEAEQGRDPQACPNDGEPLRRGADGQLFCPFDGWRPG